MATVSVSRVKGQLFISNFQFVFMTEMGKATSLPAIRDTKIVQSSGFFTNLNSLGMHVVSMMAQTKLSEWEVFDLAIY